MPQGSMTTIYLHPGSSKYGGPFFLEPFAMRAYEIDVRPTLNTMFCSEARFQLRSCQQSLRIMWSHRESSRDRSLVIQWLCLFDPWPGRAIRTFNYGLLEVFNCLECRTSIMHFRTSLKNSIRLTLFGRSLLIVVSELLANAVCWIVAGILFGRGGKTQTILSLASLAWVCAILNNGASFSYVWYHLRLSDWGMVILPESFVKFFSNWGYL